MITLADTLHPDRIRLQLGACDAAGGMRETAELLRNVSAVLDWEQLYAGMQKAAPCVAEAEAAFAICLPHARTDAVAGMVMSIGRSLRGLPFVGSPKLVRYIFCIGVPKAMDQDYLRIVGLLMRIIKQPEHEAALASAGSSSEFLDRLEELEAVL
jgi:mannitol/fructose-specific phosphotransferase system IIA component (Ntr-type)